MHRCATINNNIQSSCNGSGLQFFENHIAKQGNDIRVNLLFNLQGLFAIFFNVARIPSQNQRLYSIILFFAVAHAQLDLYRFL
jgi:hypothetical protein